MFNSVSGSSVSNTASSSMSNGIGGLVSGLDTDSLVENLTMGTSNKIDAQKQQKQLLQWKKEAYRTLTKGLTEFNDQFFSYTSKTNITSASFFEAYKINNLSSKVGLTGKLQNAKYVQINSIDQLATKTKYTHQAKASSDLSAAINTEGWSYTDLDGKSLTVGVGGKSYQLKFDSELGRKIQEAAGDDEGARQEKLSQALNQMLRDAGATGKDGKLLVETSVTDGVLSFASTPVAKVTIGGTEAVMSALGFGEVTEAGGSGTVSAGSALGEVVKKQDLAHQLSKQSVKFYLDGTMHSITLDDYTEITGTDDADKQKKIINKAVEDLNKGLLEAYGSRSERNPDGTLSDVTKQAVSAKVVTDAAGNSTIAFELADETSTFAVDSATGNVLGEYGVFAIKPGTSTKLNTSTKLENMGFDLGAATDGYGRLSLSADPAKTYTLTLSDGTNVEFNGSLHDAQEALKDKGISVAIGGAFGTELVFTADKAENVYMKDITADGLDAASVTREDAMYELKINQEKNDDGTFSGGSRILVKASDTLSKIMDKVGQSDLGANMTYSAITGTFVLESKNYGSAEKINITGGGLAKALFGIADDQQLPDQSGYKTGENAIATVTINGEKKTIERTSNLITIDGLNIELKQTHAADEDPITFDVETDADTVVENMKGFIEAYNGLIQSITTAVTTRQDADEKYEPLTDTQKESMSEAQIEKWESEAKKSVLYNDSTLKGITQSMRSALYGTVAGVSSSLSAVGITTGEWSKNGQLEFDETKFRKAISEDPAKVAALFTQQSEVDYDVNMTTAERTQRYNESGFMYRFQDILKSAVGTTTPKGTLLQIAGVENDRTDSDNQISDQIKEINQRIEDLEDQLASERERYWNKFSYLETYINKLNSQSSSLLQQFE